MPIRLIHHQRLPDNGHYSIERLFDSLRPFIDPDFQISVRRSRFLSKGVIRRCLNLIEASNVPGDLHHIVGDVYYLGNLLPSEKLILTIHDCAALERLQGFRHKLLLKYWFQRPIQRAAAITTVSEATRDELRRWIGALADKVVIIPNCVSTEFEYRPKTWLQGNFSILQVGTGWNKNLSRVVAALTGLDATLEIIGTVSEAQLSELRKSGIRFKCLGRVSNSVLVDAYRRCDMVTFASTYEGFGLPILEAQATGRPVITSNIYSMPEAAGKGAVLIDPMDVGSLRSAIIAIDQNRLFREQLISEGLKNAALYHPDKIADKYSALYRKVYAQQHHRQNGI